VHHWCTSLLHQFLSHRSLPFSSLRVSFSSLPFLRPQMRDPPDHNHTEDHRPHSTTQRTTRPPSKTASLSKEARNRRFTNAYADTFGVRNRKAKQAGRDACSREIILSRGSRKKIVGSQSEEGLAQVPQTLR